MSGPGILPARLVHGFGYTDSDLYMWREVRPETLQEFRQFPHEMTIIKFLRDTEIINNNEVFNFKKNNSYLTEMITVIELWKQCPASFKATNYFKRRMRLYQGEDLTNKRIICWVYGGFGDCLFVQPILRYLKELYPSCHITFATQKPVHPMVSQWGCIDNLLNIFFNANHFLTAHYHLNFDSIINKCKEAERVNAYKLLARWINTDIPVEKLCPKQTPNPYKVEKYKFVKEKFNKFAVVQLAASTILRTPRPEFRIKLLNNLLDKGLNIAFIDAKKNHEVIDDLISKLNHPEQCINLCNTSENISDAIGLVSLSSLVISIDTGLIHIAASLSIPCFGIYGPFPGKTRLETYPMCYWVDAPGECAPCCIHGFDPCYKAKDGYPVCYDNIDMDKMIEGIMILWNVLK